MASVFMVRNDAFNEVGKLAAIVKQLDREVAKELRTRMKREVADPLAVAIRFNANGPHGVRASQSVKTRQAAKPQIVGAARGTGLAAELFYGSEFGGGGRRTRYIGRNADWRGVVTRVTTNQFRAPNRDGYWFHPALRAGMPKATDTIARIVDDVILGRLR